MAMPSDVYDAIVVGAGPSGSTAAIVLAQHHLRVLLVDQDQFPRDKPCGDAVPMIAVQHLKELGLNVAASKDFFQVTHLTLTGPKGVSITSKLKASADSGGGMVARYVFDNMLFQRALECGAEYCNLHVTAPILEDGQVVGIKARAGKQTIEYRAKAVIAADGATSALSRALITTPRPDKHKAIAVRGYVATDAELSPTVELNFLGSFQPGYAWFFPMSRHYANIGVGIRSDYYKKQSLSLNEALNAYAATPQISRRIKGHAIENVMSWQLPLASMDQQRVFDGAILIGDAGGFVDPLTGAGIRTGIITGKYAAETVVQAIQAGDLSARGLAPFDVMWRAELEDSLKRSSLIANLAGMLPPLIDAVLLIMRIAPGFGGITGKI